VREHEHSEQRLITKTQELMAQINLHQLKIQAFEDRRLKLSQLKTSLESQRDDLKVKEKKLCDIARSYGLDPEHLPLDNHST